MFDERVDFDLLAGSMELLRNRGTRVTVRVNKVSTRKGEAGVREQGECLHPLPSGGDTTSPKTARLECGQKLSPPCSLRGSHCALQKGVLHFAPPSEQAHEWQSTPSTQTKAMVDRP